MEVILQFRRYIVCMSIIGTLLLSAAVCAAQEEAVSSSSTSSSSSGTEESADEFPVYNLSALDADSFKEMNATNRIIDQAYNKDITVETDNDCARWVYRVYTAAGVSCPYWSGADLWYALGSKANTDMTDIPVGAIVIGTGCNSNTEYEDYYYGHVGICLGDTNGDGILEVRDCTGPGSGGIHTSDINTWVSWQTDTIFGSEPRTPGFVGWVFPLQ